jgi:hypothetical protein
MEEVCERENCKQALRRVKANKGSPGIDGMTEKRDATPHDEAQAAGEQREECSGSTMGTEIPGVQLHESQATEEALGAENGGAIQGASPGAYAADTGHKPRPNGP